MHNTMLDPLFGFAMEMVPLIVLYIFHFSHKYRNNTSSLLGEEIREITITDVLMCISHQSFCDIKFWTTFLRMNTFISSVFIEQKP